MSENTIRQRVVASKDDAPTSSPKASKEASSGFSIIEIGRILVALLILFAGMSWFITGESFIWNWRQLPTLLGSAKRYISGPISLTDAELALYNGTDPALPIYVGLNGSIYDVSAGTTHYGPGGSYSFFAGRDATRAFITGCFQEDLTPDIRGVEEMYIPIDDPAETPSKATIKIRRERDTRLARKQIKESVGHWASVFNGETGRPYFYVGEIKREEGWLEKLPKRELCAQAKEGRPKREDAEKAQAAGKP